MTKDEGTEDGASGLGVGATNGAEREGSESTRPLSVADFGWRLAVLVAVAYGSLWWSYERFYNVFGITPDDVGAMGSGGVTDVFTATLRLGLWLIFVVIVLGLVPVVAVAMWGYVADHRLAENTTEGSESRRRIRPESTTKGSEPRRGILAIVAASVAVVLAIVAYQWFAGWAFAAIVGALIMVAVIVVGAKRASEANRRSSDGLTKEPDTPQIVAVSVLLGVALALTIGAYKTFAGRPFAAIVGALVLCAMAVWSSAAKQHQFTGGTDARKFRRWLEQRWRWVLHVGDAFFVVAIVGLLYVDLPTDAAEVARRVRDADLTCKVPAVRAPLPGVHLDLIGVRALPATFNSPYTSALNRPRGSIDALYLGQANGFIMAYRPGSRVLLRLPADATTVAIKAGVHNCLGVH